MAASESAVARGAQPRSDTARGTRVVFYSHDTFGLGHLRRSRALATAMTRAVPDLSALILTGSPVAGRFAFPERVDHVRLPGVTKLADGSYVSETLGFHIDETTALRSNLIRAAIESVQPDLLIVDKEPTGFRGELLPTLEMLRAGGRTRTVLGLRDVLDEADTLAAEWARKGAGAAAEQFYDEVWIYGPREFYDPTQGLDLSDTLRARMHWTGFLRREDAGAGLPPEEPYVLVTPGGGGDGQAMVDLVLSAYEQDRTLGPQAQLVYGPFLSGDTRSDFEYRVERLGGRVTALGFDAQIESLFAGAEGVVCMGGYNTFCEVLSFNQRAVIVPRTRPRKEQYIRAARARDIGLVQMLDEYQGELTPAAMAAAIRALPAQQTPATAGADALLNGLDRVVARMQHLLGSPSRAAAE